MKVRARTEVMIFHHSLSDLSNLDNIRFWHKTKGWHDCGYHFVVELDGNWNKGRDMKYVGAHSFGRNGNSVGVCICGDLHEHEPSCDQLEACQEIYHVVCRAYQKSLKVEFHRPHIFNLFEMHNYQVFNACPGSRMDRADFMEIVKRGDPYV